MSLLLVLDLVGTFVFALSGATAVEAPARSVRAFWSSRLWPATPVGLSAISDRIGCRLRQSATGAISAVSLLAGLVTFYRYSAVERLRSPVLVFDAAGLALFAVSGTQKGLAFGLNPVMAALLGMVTGVGGGMMRDVLLAEIPTVLRADLYAVAALAGATVVVIGNLLHLPPTTTTIIGALLCFGLRLMAIRRDWHLPIAKLHERSSSQKHGSDDEFDVRMWGCLKTGFAVVPYGFNIADFINGCTLARCLRPTVSPAVRNPRSM